MNTWATTLLATLLLNFSGLAAQPSSAVTNSPVDHPPRLVVGIVVEGLPFDHIQQYWDRFGEGGFKKLIRQGIYYTETELPYMLAGKGVSEATLSTGTMPSIHGIVAEKWYNRLRREEVDPTYDYTVQTIGGTGQNGKHSPHQLLATTLGDVLYLSNSRSSKVVSIALEPASSILLGGHLISGSYWFDYRTGNWITSSAYRAELPDWVTNFNSRRTGDLYLTRDWNLLLAETRYQECVPDENGFETGFFGEHRTFPYRMNRLKRASMNRDYSVIGMTPFGNTLTLDFAMAALEGEELGQDDHTDLLTIGLSAGYQLARWFGPDTREYVDILLRLDMDLQHLLFVLEEKVGKDQLLVYLVSTHGMARDPDYARALNHPNGYFRYRNAMALLNSYLGALYGDGVWVESYMNHQVYLNEKQIEESDVSYRTILEEATRFLTHFEGVAFANPTDRISYGTVPEPWGTLAQNNYHPDRSGDIILILEPGWIVEGNFDTDCQSPYLYDRHIPLIWYGWDLQPSRVNRTVQITDIAPTLSAIMGIPKPSASTGSVLTEVVK